MNFLGVKDQFYSFQNSLTVIWLKQLCGEYVAYSYLLISYESA